MAIFVVRFSVQALRVDPARFESFGIPRSEKKHIGGENIPLVHFHNVSHTHFVLRDFLELLGFFVQNFDGTVIGSLISTMTIVILTD